MELKEGIESLLKKLRSAREQVLSAETASESLKKDLDESREAVRSVIVEFTELEAANRTLQTALEAEKEAKEAGEAKLVCSKSELVALASEFQCFREDHTAAVTNLSSCIEDLTQKSDSIQKEFDNKRDKMTKELQRAEEDLVKSKVFAEKVSAELKCQKESNVAEVVSPIS